MVQISFQAPEKEAAKGQEGATQEAPPAAAAGGGGGEGSGAKADPQDVEGQLLPVQTRRSLSRMCYLTMILMLLLLGLILTSMYVYRYFSVTGSSQTYLENVFHCGIIYQDHSYSQLREQLELHEDVRIYLDQDYEQINVPMLHFGESDPADIIHDFQRGLTAYHDVALDKCYVIELNSSIVLPPQSFWELLFNVKKGAFLPQTYIIQEEMIVKEPITDMEQLGSFIFHLCHGKETYRLKRRTARRHIHRRGAENCRHIRHFENTFVVDTAICEKL